MTTTTPQATAPRAGRGKTRTVALVLLAAVAALIVIIIVAVSAGAGSNPSTRPGEQAVYDGITAQTDCGALATLFQAHTTAHQHFIDTGQTDQAATETAYMEAVAARQQQLGCP